MTNITKNYFNFAKNNTDNIVSTNYQKPYVNLDQGVSITVWPEYVDSRFNEVEIYIWAYHVRIENKRKEPIKLINRHWNIIDEKGVIQEVSGEGVVGQTPKIMPNSSYQYTSGVHLNYPSGIMSGQYQMQKENGEIFEVIIPTFSLDIPNSKPILN